MSPSGSLPLPAKLTESPAVMVRFEDGEEIVESGAWLASTGGLTVTVTQAATYTSAEALIINGNGSTLDAGGADVRALILSGSGPVTINDLTITNSVTTTGSGAVFASNSGDLTINDSTITGHAGTNGPGAILGGIRGHSSSQ